MTLGRLFLALVLVLACAHALLPATEDRDALRTRLVGGVERATARLTAAAACVDEPAARIDVAVELGPLARALAGTGRGDRVAALDAALCDAGRRVTEALSPWLREQAAGFDAPDVETLLATRTATPAFRAQLEEKLARRLAPEVEAALGAASVAERIETVAEASAALPLPRRVGLDPAALLRAHWPDAFFSVLAEEEARAPADSPPDVARLEPAPRSRIGGEVLGGDR